MNALNLSSSVVSEARQRRQTDLIGGLDYLHSVLGADGVVGGGVGGSVSGAE